MMITVLLILSFTQVSLQASIATEDEFELSIIHINDFHAKYEPVSVWTGPCTRAENDEGMRI